MSVILYIRGHQVDLDPNNNLAQTKQINDIGNISSKKSSFTNTFKLPKTANNIRVMDFMTLTANNSRVQYEKNECSLFSAETGQCFIYKGWGIITDGGENYEVAIVDGMIDFYKAIENKNLSDIGLEELTHLKTIENVIGSWAVGPYRYILADYNGDTGRTLEGEINIDYLVPSVSVKYLWDKVFEKAGFTYSGSIFDMWGFNNLWMTFPKGLATSDSDVLKFEASEFTYPESTNGGGRYKYFMKYVEADPNLLPPGETNVNLMLAEAGNYRVEVSGSIVASSVLGQPKSSRVDISFNAENTTPHTAVVSRTIRDGIPSGETVDASDIFSVSEFTSVSLIIAPGTNASSDGGNAGFILNKEETSLTVRIYKLNQNTIDFGEALIDFSIKDFVNDICNRFGLTIYPDNVTKNYEFLTLQEVLQGAELIDWSDKMVKKISENYIYGQYAQRNWFRYNYNDKEASYNDWFVDVNNVNLPDSRDVIKSKIYSPEAPSNRTTYLDRSSNVYKLWDKEPATDQETGEDLTTYKSLDKRYYFIRAEQRAGSFNVISKTLAQTVTHSGTYYMENYSRLQMHDYIQDYYGPLRRVLDAAMIVTVDLWLTDLDICNFDFRKLYYLEQLSNYFIVNKITNFISGKPTRCELVRVMYDEQAAVVPVIRITKVQTKGFDVTVYFNLSVPTPTIDFEYRRVSDGYWSVLPGISYGSNPISYTLSPPGVWEVRIKADGIYSNTVSFDIPSEEIIIP